jgi:hypothetical protein
MFLMLYSEIEKKCENTSLIYTQIKEPQDKKIILSLKKKELDKLCSN